MLTYTHRHSIDAIYIDPPYNTGAKDWKYNNDYVDSDDDYRHSKWLSFMERRLELTKELLDPDDSVLIVSIDEKEYLRLGMLLEQIFPDGRIQMISSVINPAGAGKMGSFARTDEYLFYVMFGKSRVGAESREAANVPVVWDTLRRSNPDALRTSRPNQFYPIFVDSVSGRIVSIGDPINHEIPRDSVSGPDGSVAVFPIRPNGVEMLWGITPEVARERLTHGYLRAGRRKANEPQQYVISYLTAGIVNDIECGSAISSGIAADGSVVAHYPRGRDKMPTTQWSKPAHDAQRFGSNVNRALMPDRRFPYPKSLYAVEDALRFFVQDKRDAIVLDFFSGSGTTAHAVMRLNKQDGGRRRSISITNNEVGSYEQKALRAKGLRPGDANWEALGICDFITKPRVTAAITGKTPSGDPIKGDYRFTDEFPMADGFEANARFFTLTYESPISVRHHRAFKRIAPILWMRAGQVGAVIENLGHDGWAVTPHYGVIESLDQAKSFIAAITDSGATKAFIVTDDPGTYRSIARGLPSHVASTRLYESYLKNFEINTREQGR